MKKKTETLIRVVRAFAEHGTYTAAAKLAGISRVTLGRWIELSESDAGSEVEDSQWRFELDGTEAYLHEHMQAALRAAVDDVEAGLIKMASRGTYRRTYWQGRPVWQESPQFYGWSDKEMTDLGFDPSERWLRDARGALVPVLEYQQPTFERQQLVLQAHGGEAYRKKSSVDIHQTLEGGVYVAHAIGHQPAKQIEQPKPLPELLQLPDAVTEKIVEEALAEERPAAEPELIEPEEIETPASPPPMLDAAARRAVNPGAAELLALAAMSPEERKARALRTVKNRGAWLTSGSGSNEDQ